MDNSVGRLQSLFPGRQFDVIVGSMLGDGRLECRSKGIRGSKTARFRVHHGEKQSAYVSWKYDVLRSMSLAPPRTITRHDAKRVINETSHYFHTRSMPELGVLHELFYTASKKRIPNNLNQCITPRMLAVWYMDDGSYMGSGCTFNTHSCSSDEQQYLRTILSDVFDIETSLVKDRHQYKIALGAHEFPKLVEIIRPHVIQSMSYKIAYPRNDSFRLRNGVTTHEASVL